MAPLERRLRNRRETADRRVAVDRRVTADDMPSRRMDVSRMEHENLCRQIDELIRSTQRIEIGLNRQTERIDQLDTDFRMLLRERSA
jgi:hypothetical protein